MICRDIGANVRAAFFVFPDDDDRLIDVFMHLQPAFDFAEFDPETADFHLVVDSADEFDVAVRQPFR